MATCPAISIYKQPCMTELGESYCPYCMDQGPYEEKKMPQARGDEKRPRIATTREIERDKERFARGLRHWSGFRSAYEMIRESRLIRDPSKEPDLSDVVIGDTLKEIHD